MNTRAVRLPASLGVHVNETQLKMLQKIASAGGGEPVQLSVAELGRAGGIKAAPASISLRALKGQGLLEVRSRFLPNGGQLENEYELTELGKQVLAAAC